MGTPTRFPYGVTNTAKATDFGMYIDSDPSKVHAYFNDFDVYTAGDWTVTETQAGATQALADGDGGLLLLTNSAADDDLVSLQKVGESFLFAAGKKLWFKARFAVSDATQSDVAIGLAITDTTPLAVSDAVYFLKLDGSTTMNLLVEKNGTATTTAAATIVDATNITVGFYYDGAGEIKIYADGVHVGTSATTNLPDDEALTVTIAVQNGEGAAKTLTVDYVFVAKER